ncbi:hypothetical protein [Mariniphaga sp.]|uniref:hypothetical protein n=1 Tax=Mariniphaga sp. TaxID=1954475 RepID=UPI0035668284
MKTISLKKTVILRPYSFVLTLVTLLIVLTSCSKLDTNPKGSFINFALSGSLLNGDFEIKKMDGISDYDKATGYILPASESVSETALINYQDHDQGLSINLVFPAEKKLFEMQYNDSYHISVTDLSSNTILVSKTVSMNVSEFKKTGTGILAKMSATGNFNGIMVFVDAATGQEYSHTLSGKFEFN